MKTKIVGILVCMLVLATVLPIIQAVRIDKKETTIAPFETNAVIWSKTYGGPEFDELRCVQETTDGGYIACGETEVSDNFYSWVLKVGASGNEEWNWTQTQFSYDETTFDIIDAYSICVQQVADGGYIVGLQINFMYNAEEMIFGGLAKLSATGAEQWIQIYADDFSWSFYPCSLIVESDGYLLGGMSGDPSTSATDVAMAILKTNTDGVEQWYQEYQYSLKLDIGYAVYPTSDNGYLLTGYVEKTITDYDYWMIKTDANGNMQWNKTFGGPYGDYSNVGNCFQTADGGYIQAGYTYINGSSNSAIWVVKTDSSGTMEWNNTYDENTRRDTLWSFEQTQDDGYVLCDTINLTSSAGDKEDIQLIKIDENGNIQWKQKFGGPERQIGIYIDGTQDNGLIVAGRTGLYQNAATDGLLIKFAPVDIQVDTKGGLGIQTSIKNNGISNLTNVSYEIQVKGGIFGLINKTIIGWINITAGENIPLEKIMVLGFGPITITAKVADVIQTATGTQIIIFSKVK
jgi:hypothetical protein